MDGKIRSWKRTKLSGHKRARVGWVATISPIFLFIVGFGSCTALCLAEGEAVKAGAWAKYKMLSTYTYRGEKPPLETVVFRIGPSELHDGRPLCWWQMDCQKTGGGSFSVRILSDRVPMLCQERFLLDIRRYILKEGEESPVEYVDEESGGPLLPLLLDAVEDDLAPWPCWSSSFAGPFSAQGTLLGQMLVLWESSAEGEFPLWEDTLVLNLDPGLLIGTGRNFRDTLDQRITGPENYPYRRFTKEEYDEMIEAGVNYFTVDPEQAEWIRRRPVFYEQGNLKGTAFPEILYRSNYMGAVQFVDEPACYIYGDDDAKKGAKRPADLAELLTLRVFRTLTAGGRSYSSLRLEKCFRDAGFNLGYMQIVEPDIPIWETLIHTSFDQLKSGAASGIIHEGRYRLDPFRANFKRIGIEAEWLEAKEMLLYHYAFLRGAARAWGTDWGMSIYGQADPAISPLAITLAYDLGARYVWYWTSDHGHHMPYREQLELTRQLRAHQKAHPRKSRDELREAAKVAIALPHGYAIDLGFGPLWASNDFAMDKPNEVGVPYGDVVRAAVKEALAYLKKGESFDFIFDSPGFLPTGYQRVNYVTLDSDVEVVEE